MQVEQPTKRTHENDFRDAVTDLVSGLVHWPQWLTLGNHEVIQRYQRSVLGPFWISLSMAITVAGLGTVYSLVLDQSLETYLPYLAAGLVVWNFISSCMLEGCNAFIGNERSIKQINVPFSAYVYRIVWRSLISFLHNAMVFVVIALYYPTGAGWFMLLAIPGLAILLLNLGWIAMVLALLSARYRDVPQIVGSFIGLAFLVTPILWMPGHGVMINRIVQANPLYYGVELIRGPLLATPPELVVWLGALLVALCGWIIALASLSRYRWRISYWV